MLRQYNRRYRYRVAPRSPFEAGEQDVAAKCEELQTPTGCTRQGAIAAAATVAAIALVATGMHML